MAWNASPGGAPVPAAGWPPLPGVPPPPLVPADPDAWTTFAEWLGERLDLGWVLDGLHPLATREVGSRPAAGERPVPAPAVAAVRLGGGPAT
jgi:hypothetical protein